MDMQSQQYQKTIQILKIVTQNLMMTMSQRKTMALVIGTAIGINFGLMEPTLKMTSTITANGFLKMENGNGMKITKKILSGVTMNNHILHLEEHLIHRHHGENREIGHILRGGRIIVIKSKTISDLTLNRFMHFSFWILFRELYLFFKDFLV